MLLHVHPAGHLPSPCGVWDGYSHRSNYRKPVLPGERSAAEQVQSVGSGEAVRGGHELHPEQGHRHAGDQDSRARFQNRKESRPDERIRVSTALLMLRDSSVLIKRIF